MFHVKHSVAGIDYVRLTAPHGPAGAHLKVVGEALLDLEAMSEHKQRQASRLGFRGWIAGSVFYGENDERGMLDVSGSLAGHPYIRGGCEGWQCTRIDVQLSYAEERSADGRIEVHAEEALVHRAAAKGGRPFKVTHIRGHGNGDTLNLGSRSSVVYGRIYNKEAQSNDDRWKGYVRYEVEFKKEAARDVFALVTSRSADGHLSLSIVLGAFRRWGVVLPVPPSIAPVEIRPDKRNTDSARRLRWLQSQVAPAVAQLIEEGYGEAALTALGLGSTMTPTGLYSLLEQSKT